MIPNLPRQVKRYCATCGAPVGPDGRNERRIEPAKATSTAERYDSDPGATLVTAVTPVASLATLVTGELDRLKAMPPSVGTRRWWRERAGHETGCVVCGGELPANDRWITGAPRVRRGRIYCSNACKQKAYRVRAAAGKAA